MAKGKYKSTGLSKLRNRFHDLNSQRRYRNQTTVGWEAYKKQTQMGRTRWGKPRGNA